MGRQAGRQLSLLFSLGQLICQARGHWRARGHPALAQQQASTIHFAEVRALMGMLGAGLLPGPLLQQPGSLALGVTSDKAGPE